MHDLTPVIERAHLFITQHVPPEMLDRTVALAVLLLVAGIGLSVLGAKLARPAMTVMFGLMGAYAGVWFAREAGYPAPLGGLLGAAMVGTIGLVTFRLWVGVAVGAVLTSISLGTFSYQRMAPYLAEFEGQGMVTWSPVTGATEFAVPTPEQQQDYVERPQQRWAKEFWAFVTAKDPSIPRNSRLIALGTAVTGLFLGVMAARWMLILSTSLVGTAFVVTAVATLLTRCLQGSYQAFQDHPGPMGMAVGGFLVTSLILQTLLTRKAPSDGEKPAKS